MKPFLSLRWITPAKQCHLLAGETVACVLKLTFYYGATDLWCPVRYYEEMKAEFPDGDIRLCEKGIRHAFVLEASKEVAAMVTEWVQDDLARL
ncbi:UNVERIFIED_CONTAM: hypothetical protein K2H54_033952 [Gekko kuhli]